MKNNVCLLCVSLPCSKNEWHKLFNNGIIPFVTGNEYLEGYLINLCHTPKENITLSLLATEINANKLKKESADYFKSHRLVSEFYTLQKIKNKENEKYSLSICLSQIILDALKDEVVDDATLLTFAFYMQMGLIKVIHGIDRQFINTLKPQFQAGNRNEIEKESVNTLVYDHQISKPPIEHGDEFELMAKVVINKKFEEDKETLSEITRDIFADTENTQGWLKQWLAICKVELEKYNNEEITTAYKKIIDKVYLHLGITDKTITILSYFTQRILGLINPPDVIIVGAEKCGTSSLHNTLIGHSKIKCAFNPENGSKTKEVCFFVNQDIWRKGIDWYFSHFSRPGGIDATPHYMVGKLSCERMHTILPDAKLILCIRNPVKRAYSQYNHYKQEYPRTKDWDWRSDGDFAHNINAGLQVIKAMLEQDDKIMDSMESFQGIIARGIYIKQIKNLLKYYDRSQLYITITDWWPHSYETELINIQAFLGLQKELLPPRIANKREYTVEPFDEEAKQLLTEFYKPYNQELFEFLGYEIPEWG